LTRDDRMARPSSGFRLSRPYATRKVGWLSTTAEVLSKAVAVFEVTSLDACSRTITAELAGSIAIGTYAANTLRDDELSICDFEPGRLGE
jgi:hypothetical protein